MCVCECLGGGAGVAENYRLGPVCIDVFSLIASFMGPTWGPSGADRTQVGPMLAPWPLLSGFGAICSELRLHNDYVVLPQRPNNDFLELNTIYVPIYSVAEIRKQNLFVKSACSENRHALQISWSYGSIMGSLHVARWPSWSQVIREKYKWIKNLHDRHIFIKPIFQFIKVPLLFHS